MGISLRWLPDEDFARLARESAGTGDGGALAGIIGDLLSPVVQRIRVDSRKTASALRNLGLPWPENDRSYLERACPAHAGARLLKGINTPSAAVRANFPVLGRKGVGDPCTSRSSAILR